VIYLYCLLRAKREPPAGLRGIGGALVRAVDAGGVGAWVSETASTPIAPSPAYAREHDRVVRAALEHETPLPARFGQIVADEMALAEIVSSRRSAFESALDKVEGMVEMTVRMLSESDTLDATGPSAATESGTEGRGRGYLERVAAVHRQERNVLAQNEIVRERVSSAVRGLVRDERFAGATVGSSMVTLSHLVPRENIDEYRSALLVLRNDQPALAIMVSGPWAPYSFTEGVGA
jgi:hypothetical protein